MSELDDIVAAAGIVIVDSSAPGDGGDADNKESEVNGVNPSKQKVTTILSEGSGDTAVTPPQVTALESMFSHRYTMEDEGYARTVDDAEFNMSPPCVPNFREKRSGDFNRRGRGGRGGWGGGRDGGGYNRHDNYNNRQSYRDREDSYNRQSYRDREDHYNRNWHSQHRDGGDGSRGYQGYQDRHRSRERY